MTKYFPVEAWQLKRLHDDFTAGQISDESFVETVRQMIEEHEIVIGDHVVFDLRTDPSLYWWTVRGVYDNVVWCSTATAGHDIRQEFPIRAITGKAGKDPS